MTGVCGPAGVWGDLRVDLPSEEGVRANVSLDRPVAGSYRTRNPRGLARLDQIRCRNGAPVVVRTNEVVVSEGCDTLQWSFDLEVHRPGAADASSGSSWFSAHGWWLVQEAESVLRLAELARSAQDVARPSKRRRVSFRSGGVALASLAGPARLPVMHEAPGLWLLGSPVFTDKRGLRHFFDSGTVPGHMDMLLDRHAEAVASLSTSLPGRALTPVFWMGVGSGRMSIGGAAGTGLALANYPLTVDELGEETSAITLYVGVHEHAHQLFDSRGVLWLSESVASYLALRAIRDTSPEMMPFLEETFLRPGREPRSLPDLGERARVDPEAYAMLYSVGAAFWWAFDALLAESGRHLPAVLPHLLAEGFDPRGRPLPDTLAEIAGLPAGALRLLCARYFSTADAAARHTARPRSSGTVP